jgi:hypothetical protein
MPYSPDGVGVPYVTYGSGRMGASMTYWGGLHQIVFYGDVPMGSPSTYFEADASSAYVRLFRLQVVAGGVPYTMEFSDTEHFAFGYASRFRIDSLGLEFVHHMTLLDSALVYTVECVANPRGVSLSLQLEHHEHTRRMSHGDLERTWSDWAVGEDGAISCTVHDRLSDEAWHRAIDDMSVRYDAVGLTTRSTGLREGTVYISLVTDGELNVKTHRGRTYVSSSEFASGSKSVALLFASSEAKLEAQTAAMRDKLPDLVSDRESEARRLVDFSPRLEIGNDAVSSFFANSPEVVASLFVEGAPGAMRAANMHYWVWGWDTLMCAEALLISGRQRLVWDMLLFYKNTADPELGVGHQFTRELKVRIPQAAGAQCLYLIALHAYVVYMADSALVNEVYSFAKEIFKRALASRTEAALGTGPALWPDFPICAGHTGHDCSSFNNSILYQGVRCMAILAAKQRDTATVAEANAAARLLEKSFTDAFWDSDRNYFVDSVDSETGEQRKSYPSHAMLWQSPFCADLAPGKLKDCAKFIAEHHATHRGFLPYPRWDNAFNGDHNQLGQAWPITDVFDTRCLAVAGDQAALTTWLDSVGWFWSQLTIPEAYTMVTANESGTPDAPGGKQPFSAKSWYMAAVTSVAGIDYDSGGITFGPGLEQKVVLDDACFTGYQARIELEGAGDFPESLTVNDIPVVGSCKVPYDIVDITYLEIRYRRTALRPSSPVILALHGGIVHTVDVTGGGELVASVALPVDTWLRFGAPRAASVTIGGREVAAEFDDERGIGQVLLPATGEQAELRISAG